MFTSSVSLYTALNLKGRRDHSLVLRNKGICYCEQGLHNEAMAVFEEAKHAYEHAGAVTSNEYCTLLKEMGACSLKRGHSEEASQLLSAAERICNAEQPKG